MLSVRDCPFPTFGGKSAVADIVWSAIGDVDNWIEPFAFSAADNSRTSATPGRAFIDNARTSPTPGRARSNGGDLC